MLAEVFVPGLCDAPLSLLYGRCRATDPALSDAIHDSTGRKPWTATQLPNGMRLTFLEDAPREAVLRGLNRPIEIRTVDTYAGIVARSRPVDSITLRFVTPTCAGHRHRDRNKPGRERDRGHLLPEARCIFGSIRNRWCGPPLPDLDWNLVWSSEVELHTRKVRLPALDHRFATGPLFRGVVGQVRYEFPTMPADQRQVMTALGLFARYCGVGSRTGYGMGYVEVTIDGCVESRDAGTQQIVGAQAAG